MKKTTDFKAFRVDPKDFALFDYWQFIKNGKESKEYNTQYKPGDVVYIKAENSAAVVIGCIDEDSQDLRTDVSGMVCNSEIEFYNPEKHPSASLSTKLEEVLKSYIPYQPQKVKTAGKATIALLLILSLITTANAQNARKDAAGNYHALNYPPDSVATGKTYEDAKGNLFPVFISKGQPYYGRISPKTGKYYRSFLRIEGDKKD